MTPPNQDGIKQMDTENDLYKAEHILTTILDSMGRGEPAMEGAIWAARDLVAGVREYLEGSK